MLQRERGLPSGGKRAWLRRKRREITLAVTTALLLAALGWLLSGCTASRPGEAPAVPHGVDETRGGAILFEPGNVSSAAYELNANFSADGREFFFTRANGDWSEMTIYQCTWSGLGWSPPRQLPFNGDYVNADPFLSPNGGRLYFASRRDAAGTPTAEFDLFYVDRNESGWGKPVPLVVLNNPASDVYPVLTADHSLYFCSKRVGGLGAYDVYRSAWKDGRFQPPVNVDAPVNSRYFEVDAFVTPDQDLLFFTGHDRDDTLGKGDIYVCFKRQGSWTSPVNLGRPVNSEYMELCPSVGPDGQYLFFSSTRPREGEKRVRGKEGRNLGDIYVTDLASLPVMRDHGWEPPKR